MRIWNERKKHKSERKMWQNPKCVFGICLSVSNTFRIRRAPHVVPMADCFIKFLRIHCRAWSLASTMRPIKNQRNSYESKIFLCFQNQLSHYMRTKIASHEWICFFRFIYLTCGECVRARIDDAVHAANVNSHIIATTTKAVSSM